MGLPVRTRLETGIGGLMRVDHKTLKDRFKCLPYKQEFQVFSFTRDLSNPQPNANGVLIPKSAWDLILVGTRDVFPEESK